MVSPRILSIKYILYNKMSLPSQSNPYAQVPQGVSFTAFGREYTPQDILAYGGEGQVYRQGSDGFVVKIQNPPVGRVASNHIILKAEAVLGQALGHPRIVKVKGIEEIAIGESPALAVQFPYHGENLHNQFKMGEISLQQAMTYLAQAACVLPYLATAGVTHRDLKKPNIFIDENGAVVGDFGLALIGQGSSGQSSSLLGIIRTYDPTVEEFFKRRALLDVATGSIGNASPEQIHNPRLVGPASDVYSMATIVYGLLTKTDFNRAFARDAGRLPNQTAYNESERVSEALAFYNNPMMNRLVRELPVVSAQVYGLDQAVAKQIISPAIEPLQSALVKEPSRRCLPDNLYNVIMGLSERLQQVPDMYCSQLTSARRGLTSMEASPTPRNYSPISSPVPSRLVVDVGMYLRMDLQK